MKIVIAKMHDEKREVLLEEVEYDGSMQGLCALLNLYRCEEFFNWDDGSIETSGLVINKDYSCIENPRKQATGRQWRINGENFEDNSILAFVGLATVLDGKAPLTIDYLQSTIMYGSKDNPFILTPEEKLEWKKQFEN